MLLIKKEIRRFAVAQVSGGGVGLHWPGSFSLIPIIILRLEGGQIPELHVVFWSRKGIPDPLKFSLQEFTQRVSQMLATVVMGNYIVCSQFIISEVFHVSQQFQ